MNYELRKKTELRRSFKKALVLTIILYSLFIIPAASAAVLYIYPQAEEVYEDGTISAEVRLDTEGESVNTIEASVLVLGEQFEIADFSTGGSVFHIFVNGPEIFKDEGSVFFQAIAPGGFEGEGVVGRVLLKANNLGEGIVKIAQASKVLLNDGNATQAETKFLDTSYRVVERPEGLAVITSDSHPIETEWRSGTFIRLEWELKEGATYSYVLSRLPDEVPDEVPEEAVGDIKLTTAEEGVFYFHLRECFEDGSGGSDPRDPKGGQTLLCGPTATRQILRDTSAPEEFEPVLGQDDFVYNGEKFLSFTTSDKYSGLSHFEVFEGEERYVAKSPYRLHNQEYIGAVLVKAIDKAGNAREATIMIPGETSDINSRLLFGIMGSIAGVFVAYLLWRFAHRRKLKKLNE